MAGPADCTAMTADQRPEADEGKGNCGLPECLAMAMAGCAAMALPSAQPAAKLLPREMASYFGAVVQAPVGVPPFPEIRPPII